MRHLVHTEHYKKNARGQALSRHFHPTLQSWLAHSISATGQASMPAVLLELRVLHTLFCDWLSEAHEAHEGLSPPHSTVSAESPWQGSSDCTISHLPALKSSGNQDSVPDIPLKHFASSISSFSRPLAESPVSWTWFNFVQWKYAKSISENRSGCPGPRALALAFWLPWVVCLTLSKASSHLFLLGSLGQLCEMEGTGSDQVTRCEDLPCDRFVLGTFIYFISWDPAGNPTRWVKRRYPQRKRLGTREWNAPELKADCSSALQITYFKFCASKQT